MKPSHVWIAMSVCASLQANELQLYSVPTEYTMTSYEFQVESETHRARVVLHYTWPEYVMGGDTGPGPEPVPIELTGLSYDVPHHQVVYAEGNKQTVCASVHSRHFLFWSWMAVTPTGECIVKSRRVRHDIDSGWDIKHREMTDSFIDIH